MANVVKHFKWEPKGKRRMHKRPSARGIAEGASCALLGVRPAAPRPAKQALQLGHRPLQPPKSLDRAQAQSEPGLPPTVSGIA